MMQRSIAFIIMLIASTLISSANAITVSATPAWNGFVHNGTTTEVAIRAFADRGGQVDVTLSGTHGAYHYRTQLSPRQEMLWRPTVTVSDDLMQLRVQLSDGSVIEETVAFHRHANQSPLIGLIGSELSPQNNLSDYLQGTIIPITKTAMPYKSESYASLNMVIVHMDVLTGITAAQLSALQHYSQQCGRLIIVGISPLALTSLAKFAGCKGEFLSSAESFNGVADIANKLMQQPVPELPSEGNLTALLGSEVADREIGYLTAFFLLYFCTLLVALNVQRVLPYLLGIYSIAMLVAFVTWSLSSQQNEKLTWAEAYTGDQFFRYRTLHRIRGGGQNVAKIITSIETASLLPLQTQELDREYSSDVETLSFTTTLFAHRKFAADGISRYGQPLRLDYVNDEPQITNTSENESESALLAWNDARYTVPALTAGDKWRPGSKPESWPEDRAEKLFRQRALRSPAALLIATPLGISGSRDSVSEYLMLRP